MKNSLNSHPTHFISPFFIIISTFASKNYIHRERGIIWKAFENVSTYRKKTPKVSMISIVEQKNLFMHHSSFLSSMNFLDGKFSLFLEI